MNDHFSLFSPVNSIDSYKTGWEDEVDGEHDIENEEEEAAEILDLHEEEKESVDE